MTDIEQLRMKVDDFVGKDMDLWHPIVMDRMIDAACREFLACPHGSPEWSQLDAMMDAILVRLQTPEALAQLSAFLRQRDMPVDDAPRILSRARALIASAASAAAAQAVAQDPGVGSRLRTWIARTLAGLSDPGPPPLVGTPTDWRAAVDMALTNAYSDAPTAAARFWIGYWLGDDGGTVTLSSPAVAVTRNRFVDDPIADLIADPMDLRVWLQTDPGPCREHPEMALLPMCSSFLGGMERVSELCAGGLGFIWLLSPWNSQLDRPLSGDSLTLATALLIKAAREGAALDSSCVALGVLETGESIRAVSAESKKLGALKKAPPGRAPITKAVVASRGSDLLSENSRAKTPSITVIPVDNVSTAFKEVTLEDALYRKQRDYERAGPLIRVSIVDELIKDITDEACHVNFHGEQQCGRKRIAVAVAQGLRQKHGWHGKLVSLRGAKPDEILARVFAVFGMGGKTTLKQLGDLLKQHSTVIVFHDLGDLFQPSDRDRAASLFNDMLSEFTTVRSSKQKPVTCLFVGREKLGLHPVRDIEIGPLETNAKRRTKNGLAEVESVKLFVLLVKAKHPQYNPDYKELLAIQDLCLECEGFPGLIQTRAGMYSAHYRNSDGTVMPVADFCRSLTSPSRAHSADSTFDWLAQTDPGVADVYKMLSVFPSDFTLEGAYDVCGGNTITRPLIDRAVERLCEIYLLQRSDNSPGATVKARYHFKRVVRTDAQGRVSALESETLFERLISYFLELTQPTTNGPTGSNEERKKWLALIGPERTSIVRVCEGAIGKNSEKEGARLALAVWRLFEETGHYREGQELIERFIDRGTCDENTNAWLSAAAGWLAYRRGNIRIAEPLLRKALKIFEGQDNVEGQAMVLNDLSAVEARHQHWPEAIQNAKGSYKFYTQLIGQDRTWGRPSKIDFVRGQAISSNNLGRGYRGSGDQYNDAARTAFDHAVAHFMSIGRDLEALFPWIEIGYLELGAGNSDGARHYAVRVRDTALNYGQQLLRARALTLLGHVTWRLDTNAPSALGHYKQALQIFLLLDDERGMTEVLEAMSCLALAGGEIRHAGRLFGSARGWRDKNREPLPKYARTFCEPIFSRATTDSVLTRRMDKGEELMRRYGIGRIAGSALRHVTAKPPHDDAKGK